MFGHAIGSIRITVVEARNLANEDIALIGKNDAYVVVKCNHIKNKTRVIPNAGSKAIWNETFNCPIKSDSEIHLSVYDQDTIRDDLIGETKIPIDGIIDNGYTEFWYGVGKGSKSRGEVLLRIQYNRQN